MSFIAELHDGFCGFIVPVSFSSRLSFALVNVAIYFFLVYFEPYDANWFWSFFVALFSALFIPRFVIRFNFIGD